MKRIQMRRTKGWRKPDDAIYVGRPTKWGNPWRIQPVPRTAWDRETPYTVVDDDGNTLGTFRNQERARYWAVIGFRRDFSGDATRLWGRDLACWCPLDQPCHAPDVRPMTAQGSDSQPARTE